MKFTVIPNKDTNLDKLIEIGASAFIFGLKDFSCSDYLNLSPKEIKEICDKYKEIDIFVSLNKNLFNGEVEKVETLMDELNDAGIKGVLFYDMAVLSIFTKKKYSFDLVWNQTHMVTNYNTCNYYYSKNVKYAYVSGELTLEEINEIKEKTKMTLFTTVFGYPVMSYTRRSLLSNFYQSIGKKKDSNIKEIKNDNNSYIISEEENGNTIYNGKLLNAAPFLSKIKSDYLVLNAFNVENSLLEEVLMLYIGALNNDEEKVKKCNELIGNYEGFFFTKTIYKVKK